MDLRKNKLESRKKNKNTDRKRKIFRGMALAAGLGTMLAGVLAYNPGVYAGPKTVELDDKYQCYTPSLQDGKEQIELTEGEIPEYGVNIPGSYDARSHAQATPVRSQNPYGTCWAFASLACMEGSLMSQKLHGNPDLSERHFMRYAFANIGDPLGGTNNDAIEFTGSDIVWEGGNVKTYYHVLANWKGAINEADAPYTDQSRNDSVADAYYKDIAHLQNFYRISRNDMNGMKEAIMQYGAVTSSLYGHLCFLTPSTGGYYTGQPDPSLRNHTVTIIGWNDSYSRNNFRLNPGMDGAWLVKDSLGTQYAQAGYMWVSYAEPTLDDVSCVFVAELADNYNNNYQYDGSYLDSFCTLSGSNSAIANVFTVTGGNKQQELKAVSFDVESPQVNYSIQIYRDLQNPKVPTSGKAMLQSPVVGSTRYSGYYTVKLPAGIYLNPSRNFAVVITLSKGGENIQVREEAGGFWNNTYFTAAAKPNQSFRYLNGNWEDYGETNGVNLRIKAFTNNTNRDPYIEPEGIGLTYDSMKLNVGESRKIGAVIEPKNATDKTVVFASSNTSVATIDATGLIRAVAPGTSVITGTTVNGLVGKCVLNVVINPTSISLNKSSETLYFGDYSTLVATLTPSNVTEKKITWTSDNPKIGDVNGGVVHVWDAGILTVTAKTVNNLTAKCVFTILSEDNPENPFADIKSGTWQYNTARYAYDGGYMNGKGELIPGKVLFSPNTAVDRSQFVQILYNVEGRPEVEYTPCFIDVPEGKWFSIPVTWAVKNSIVSDQASKFDVYGKTSREQLATMFYNYAKFKGYDVTLKGGKTVNDFPDGNKVSSWAVAPLNWALSYGVLSGKGNGMLDPSGTATRAECAAILRNFMEAYKDDPGKLTLLPEEELEEDAKMQDEIDADIDEEIEPAVVEETDEEIETKDDANQTEEPDITDKNEKTDDIKNTDKTDKKDEPDKTDKTDTSDNADVTDVIDHSENAEGINNLIL